MKILHINASQQGGAALCAIRICKALNAQGIESRMLFADGKELPEGIDGAIARPDKNWWDSNILTRIARRVLVDTPLYPMDKYKMDRKLQKVNSRLPKRLYLHGPFSNYKNIAHHPLVEWADVIHLHWVPDFVDYPTFFKEVKKPIVWTLHDHFPAVGVMHFEKNGKESVPTSLKCLDIFCRDVKHKSLETVNRLNVVAISKQMEIICKKSDILGGFPITLINNGIEEYIYKPVDKLIARKALGIQQNHFVISFCSQTLSDERKGLRELILAIERIGIKNITIVCIGGGDLPIKTSINVIKAGTISNSSIMNLLYSSSDYFAMPSYQEGFAQTPMEAMACGTPVIAFPCSGTEELITNENGIICDDFTVDALESAINQALNTHFDRDKVRDSVVSRFRYDLIAKKYIDLYNSILH